MITVGTRIVIERDEKLFPSRGTWPQYRGHVGTVVEINDDEFGVVFGRVRKARANGSIAMAEAVWFKAHELRALASQRPSEPQTVPAPCVDTGAVLTGV